MVIEERTRKVVSDRKLCRGIVYIMHVDGHVFFEYGYFYPSCENILLYDERDGCTHDCISKNISDDIMFSNKTGYYIIKPQRRVDINEHRNIRGHGNYPYRINREYEAMKSFDLFKGNQKVVSPKSFPLSKYLQYTFGVEFETSEGYVPQDICYRDGLIPLRDGSISGIEYSTVVLSGEEGLNLLKQQCETLTEHCSFNKNCALHIHFGGYPINETAIFILYRLLYCIQNDIEKFIPPYSFKTSQYKDNGKDYCLPIPFFQTFAELYLYMSGGNAKYLGDLCQAHPCDIERMRKWEIHTRYHNFNFVNMMFYKTCKTLELRFLRPSFNFDKIYLWIAIFNGILQFAEKESHFYTLKDIEKNPRKYQRIGIMSILETVYDDEMLDYILDGIIKMKCIVKNQIENGDMIGENVQIEDAIFNSKIDYDE